MSIASFSHVITDAGVGIGGLADENPNVIQGFDEAGWRRGGEVTVKTTPETHAA